MTDAAEDDAAPADKSGARSPRADKPDAAATVIAPDSVTVACRLFSPPLGLSVAGFSNAGEVVDGYAISRGVARSQWDAWHASNIDADIVKTGAIYAVEEQR